MKRFLKLVSLICVLGVLFALPIACKMSGKDKTNDGNENINDGIIYNSTRDFSGEQGYKNWYYMTARDSLDDTEYMVWDSEMCTWRTKDINCLIEPHILHPAQLDQVIRAWKAPESGRVVITTVLQRRPVNRNGVGQDGCYVYIALSDDDILRDEMYGATDLDYHYINTSANVTKGQVIYFVLNCNGNYTFDQTYWDLTIKYSEEEVPSEELEMTEKPKNGNAIYYSVAKTEELPANELTGKTFLFLGSSVTYGASGGEGMAEFIAKRNGATCIKKAVGGTTLVSRASNSYVARLDEYLASTDRVAKIDAFVCQLSTNDVNFVDTLGEISAGGVTDASAFNTATTFGAIEYIIARVKQVYNCPIVFYTNPYFTNSVYSRMVREMNDIAQKWDITVIDMYSDEAFNNITEGQRALYMSDIIHPTRAGYREWVVPKFETALKALVK